MISSEIAKATGRSLSALSNFPKRPVAKSNPQLLAPQDGVVLSGGLDNDKNLSHGAKISACVQDVKLMLPLGTERSQTVMNSRCHGAELRAKSGVSKYANPAPIEVHGQMWNIS